MLSDPQSITIDGDTTSLPRTRVLDQQAWYSSDDSTVTVNTSHKKGKRIRSQFRVDLSKISADVFLPSQNVKQSMSCYIVWDVPLAGYSPAEAADAFEGLVGLLTASSNQVLNQFLTGQS